MRRGVESHPTAAGAEGCLQHGGRGPLPFRAGDHHALKGSLRVSQQIEEGPHPLWSALIPGPALVAWVLYKAIEVVDSPLVRRRCTAHLVSRGPVPISGAADAKFASAGPHHGNGGQSKTGDPQVNQRLQQHLTGHRPVETVLEKEQDIHQAQKD